jgi:hypothetical protein
MSPKHLTESRRVCIRHQSPEGFEACKTHGRVQTDSMSPKHVTESRRVCIRHQSPEGFEACKPHGRVLKDSILTELQYDRVQTDSMSPKHVTQSHEKRFMPAKQITEYRNILCLHFMFGSIRMTAKHV